MPGPYIMPILNEHLQNYSQQIAIKQSAGKVNFCNQNLAIKDLRTNEKIVNFSVLYSAVSQSWRQVVTGTEN